MRVRRILATLLLILLLVLPVSAHGPQIRSASHRNRLGGLPTVAYDSNAVTFTPGMAKRTGPGPFAAAPIVQGAWDGSGAGDNLESSRGNQVTGVFYDNFDGSQGSVVFWWTPERTRDATFTTDEWLYDIDAQMTLRYEHDNNRLAGTIGAQLIQKAFSSVAGTTYNVVVRWDTANTLDGTNYASISVNDAHSFIVTSAPSTITPDATINWGLQSFDAVKQANAIIEGLTVYRRVLWDGAYGTDVGNGDELAAIYAAGAGADPTLTTGSWDVVFALPTDSSTGALVSGTGEAWSHPHSSAVLDDSWGETAYSGSGWTDKDGPLALNGLTFDGTDTSVIITDAVALQDLADDAFTAEGWIRGDSLGEGNTGHIFGKRGAGADGWAMLVGIEGLRLLVQAATTRADSRSGTDEWFADGKLHHVAAQFNDAGNRRGYLWVDGIPVASYAFQSTAVGAIATDVGVDLYHGNRSDSAVAWDGLLGGWSRISNILRYANGEAFVPNGPTNPPTPDGNTAWQTDYSDGAGNVLTDDSGNGNDGFASSHTWLASRDLDDISGDRIFGAGGYQFGVDAADEGITQTVTSVVSGTDYVIRPVVSVSADGNAIPEIVIYDNDNDAAIVTFTGPTYVGAHDGVTDTLILDDSSARWVMSLVGAEVYNITDGSSGTIVTQTQTTISATLTGGTDNDWDVADTFRIVWSDGYSRHPWVEPFTFEAQTTEFAVLVVNAAASGSINVQQVEVQEQLVDNPSLEYGVFDDTLSTADVVTVTVGTTASGTLTDTFTENGVYLNIAETAGTPGADVRYEFSVTGVGSVFNVVGRYEGNPAHTVNVEAWNGAGWDVLGTWGSSGTDSLQCWFPTPSHTIGGKVVIRFDHASPGNVNHDFFFDHVTLSEGTFIPGGWTNNGLDAGDTGLEGVSPHSGSFSLHWDTTASVEGLTQIITSTSGQFYAIGGWFIGDGAKSLIIDDDDNEWKYQATGLDISETGTTATDWGHTTLVARATDTTPVLSQLAEASASGLRLTDDWYVVVMDDVAVTVTPASEANSAESGGLRVDGLDTATQPTEGILRADEGRIVWQMRMRHSPANMRGFRQFGSQRVMRATGDVSNYVRIYIGDPNIITLSFNDGGSDHLAMWDATGAWAADQLMEWEVRWDSDTMELVVDGSVRALITQPIDFDVIPATIYWGSRDTGQEQADAVFLEP